MKYIIDNDLHIHSKISSCSNDPEQTNERILRYAEENGLTFGDDFTMNNENQTITLTADGWEKVSAGA